MTVCVGSLVPAVWGLAAMTGCNSTDPSQADWFKPQLKGQPTTAAAVQKAPPPLDLLLPKAIRIHPFTGTRTFDEAGGIRGIDVRIEMVDGSGDAIKAFGDFRFELHRFRAISEDPKGPLAATWVVSLSKPNVNMLHWDKLSRTYKFKLQWDTPIPVGDRFVMVAAYSSPFTQRLIAQRVFVSGQ